MWIKKGISSNYFQFLSPFWSTYIGMFLENHILKMSIQVKDEFGTLVGNGGINSLILSSKLIIFKDASAYLSPLPILRDMLCCTVKLRGSS